LVIDVSPNCDCHDENDVAIVPDVGMFASFDPVALDQACADAVNRQPLNPNTLLTDGKRTDKDHFKALHPETNWQDCVAHAEKIGMGTSAYELIEVK
jgi:hypothetical protein